MKITVTSTAGFCFGVRRAVEQTESLTINKPEDGGEIVTLGPLIQVPY